MREEFYRIKRLPPYIFSEINNLKADLRKQDPRSQQFNEGLNSLKKTRLLWKDVNEAYEWEDYDGVDARRVRVLQQIEWLKPEKD